MGANTGYRGTACRRTVHVRSTLQVPSEATLRRYRNWLTSLCSNVPISDWYLWPWGWRPLTSAIKRKNPKPKALMSRPLFWAWRPMILRFHLLLFPHLLPFTTCRIWRLNDNLPTNCTYHCCHSILNLYPPWSEIHDHVIISCCTIRRIRYSAPIRETILLLYF